MGGLSPDDVCRTEARRIAEFYYPRHKVNRLALENDIFLALARAVEASFVAGLERAPESTAAVRFARASGREPAVEAAAPT